MRMIQVAYIEDEVARAREIEPHLPYHTHYQHVNCGIRLELLDDFSPLRCGNGGTNRHCLDTGKGEALADM